jgi:hypothetical protein
VCVCVCGISLSFVSICTQMIYWGFKHFLGDRELFITNNEENADWNRLWIILHVLYFCKTSACTLRLTRKSRQVIIHILAKDHSVLFIPAARPQALSNTGIVGSNPTQGMGICVCLFCLCVVLCVGSGLATGWSPVQGVLPTVYKLRNQKSGQVPHGCSVINR